MPLEINLLPEFGWSILNQPVYGPGSVFQGFVKINISESQLQRADRLRIVFHATESTYSSGYATPVYHNQLFGSQKVLWNRKDLESPTRLTPNIDISIPFIIQMPMIQFPPSANIVAEGDGLSYHSNFILSVYLDSQIQGQAAIMKSHKAITYMPFIETSISKKPVSITSVQKKSSATSAIDNNAALATSVESLSPSVNVSMSSLDYVPGDTINISLSINNIPRKSVEFISTKLYQIQIWNRTANNKGKTSKGDRKVKHLVAQNSTTLPPDTSIKNEPSSSSSPINATTSILASTSLGLPLDLIPTFTYGTVFSIMYQLQISIKRKGKLWTFNFDLTDIPVTIGTLGYGIRSSEEIKFYSTFRGVFDQPEEISNSSTTTTAADATVLPVPKFLNFIEYEESLPVYNDDRLPSYESLFTLHQPYMGCIM